MPSDEREVNVPPKDKKKLVLPQDKMKKRDIKVPQRWNISDLK